MLKRIRRVLLVCNSFDSFSLEEDGHIETKIKKEYADFNLTTPPVFERAESTIDALKLIEEGQRYDAILTMYNVGELDVFEFAKKVKTICPDTPIVLLSSFYSAFNRALETQDKSALDYVFCWNSSTDLIVAIIKLLEDKMNAEHDCLEMGSRAILLIEDSLKYYSAYLPMLYNLVLAQNSEAVKDAINEEQQVLRQRTRPKIMLARCYDEAQEIYNKYKDNIVGIISDIGFVLHKGEPSKLEKTDAGIEFAKEVRAEIPTMPILLQSSQESMRAIAEELGLGFVCKTSKTLIHDVETYIGREFGFGDFVAVIPKTGKVIARARNLQEFEDVIRTLNAGSLIHLASKNYISRWLYGRGMFQVGNLFRPIILDKNSNVEEVRALYLKIIRDYRVSLGLGMVAKFNADIYNDTIRFARAGNGSLGGKARGLAFLNQILYKYNLYDKWEDVRVVVPRTLVVTTEYFDRFIIENGLQYVINADITDEEILSEFVSSRLPDELMNVLKVFVKNVKRPLAVRSSSKLEDSYYQPFAGVYSTYMIPRTENEDQMLRLLAKAIKSVYASVFFSSARSYIVSTANMISEEKMAVVLQEICGSEEHGYYFPAISGVLRSVNFYPIGHEAPEDGVVKLAYGLGKAVVDGDQVLRFCPKYPKHVLQTSTPDLTMKETQQAMFALNLQPEKFKTSVDDAVNFERIPISECGKFTSLKKVVSTFDYENMRIVDSPAPRGPKFVTFAHLLKYNTYPLSDILCTLMDIAKKEVKSDFEMEFAMDFDLDGDGAVFKLLQIRPIASEGKFTDIDWSTIDSEGALLTSESAIGPGIIEGVHDIVYVKEEAFDILKTREIAAELKELNAQYAAKNEQYALVGYGRWGSSIPSLGVPVVWGDINAARVIVECCLENFRVDPSQGTHFFQNLTSFGAGYVNVNPYSRKGDFFDTEKLNSLPAKAEREFLRVVHFDQPLTICIDGKTSRALIK